MNIETGPAWPDRLRLARKFRQHRREFARHDPLSAVTTVEQYEQSSLDTISNGVRVTYTDLTHAVPRVGYFDSVTQRFTALTVNEHRILTHFLTDDEYVRNLPDSDYP